MSSFHKSDWNEILNHSLTDLYLINCLIVYRANIVHQKEAIYRLLNESKIFIKFCIYNLHSTPIVLYSLVLISLI